MKKKNITVFYSLIQGFMWMNYCTAIAFASVYLLGKDFSNSEIGIYIAAAGVLSAVLQPVTGILIDKIAFIKPAGLMVADALLIAADAMLLIFAPLPHAVRAVCYGLIIALVQLGNPLANSLGMQYMNIGYRLNFGIARGMGSLFYALASVVMGKLVDSFGITLIPVSIMAVAGGLCISTIVFGMAIGKTPDIKKASDTVSAGVTDKADKGSFVKKYPRFLLSLLGITILFVNHNMIANYMYQIVVTRGGNQSDLGLLNGLSALVELPTMFLFVVVYSKKGLSTGKCIKLSGCVMTLKALLISLSAGLSMMYLAMLVQILGYALFAVVSVYYVNEIIDRNYLATGQSLMTVTSTLGAVIGGLLGGLLIDGPGVNAMCFTAVACGAIGTAIMIIAGEDKKLNHKLIM